MKKSLLVLLIVFVQISFAQSPQSFKYQAVVRDATGALAVNKIISIKSSLLLGSPTGSSVYTETQTLSTNDFGVVSLNIGAGTVVSGNFSTISWGAGTYFVKTELDINGGSTYVFMGTSQMLSVPYALYAEKTGSSVSDFDTSPTNEIQTLSVTANSLSISSGNTVALPPDADSNPSNEIQNLQIVGDSLKISNGNAVKISGSIDLDASPLNEIQNLSYNQDTIKISLANTIVLPHDADRDSLNELQTLSISNKTITLSKGNSINLMDNDSLNEIQTLTLNQGTLKLSKANSVHLPDSSATNEIQTLSINNNTITLSQGNSISINTTKSLIFPEGIDGSPVSIFSNSAFSYTVPTGKNLYLTRVEGSGFGSYNFGLDVFPSATILSNGSGGYIMGILVNATTDIQIVNSVISTGSGYTVPAGKTFYLKSVNNGNYLTVTISGITYNTPVNSVDHNAQPLIFPAGSIINTALSSGSPTSTSMTGYLK